MAPGNAYHKIAASTFWQQSGSALYRDFCCSQLFSVIFLHFISLEKILISVSLFTCFLFYSILHDLLFPKSFKIDLYLTFPFLFILFTKGNKFTKIKVLSYELILL